MSSNDLELAGKIGELISRFSQEWQDYQDWLRDIVASHSVLLRSYSPWQAVIIFRWRLFYFVVYVTSVILVNQLLRKLQNVIIAKDNLLVKILSGREIDEIQIIRFEQYQSILQRIATLLAVAELTLCSIAAFSGILLAFYYQPTALGAYKSLAMIANEVSNGSLILSLHNIAGNILIVLALIQLVVMFLGRQFLLSWLTAWLSGIWLTLAAIGLSWTAIVLNWEQISFWRFKVELSIVASVPLIGSLLQEILSGGNGISSITLQHMYTLHSYILSIVAIILSISHLTALICQEKNWRPEDMQLRWTQLCRESSSKEDSLSA